MRARAAYGTDIDQWQLDFLRANEAHAISNGDGVTVAVIDRAWTLPIPTSLGRSISGFNPDGVGAPDGTSDTEGHGTAMALLIAGHGTTHGIAPKSEDHARTRIEQHHISRVASTGPWTTALR